MSDLETRGRSVRLFLLDGSASGELTAEIMNWSGHLYVGSRSNLEHSIKRDELRRTGIYFLIGPDDDGDLPKIYVGESDDISKRLYSHNRDEKKDFWERFFAFTSKDLNLTKAHVKFLEAECLAVLANVKKAVIANSEQPKFDRLPESDIADMRSFLDHVKLLLPVVGVDAMNVSKVKTSSAKELVPAIETEDLEFTFESKTSGASATAVEIGGEFIILAGSVGLMQERVSFKDHIKSKRDGALKSGRVIRQSENLFRLVEDISFSSPSGASQFLMGTSRNGRADWRTANGTPYGDFKDRLLREALDQAHSEID